MYVWVNDTYQFEVIGCILFCRGSLPQSLALAWTRLQRLLGDCISYLIDRKLTEDERTIE
jgi:hypothetical protein